MPNYRNDQPKGWFFFVLFQRTKSNDTFGSKKYRKTAGRLFRLDVSTSQKTQQPAEFAGLRQSSAHSCAFDVLTQVKTDAQTHSAQTASAAKRTSFVATSAQEFSEPGIVVI